MPEKFDAYKKWLAIPPAEQPPNLYRLLGVPLYEHDLDTIENAVDQRMTHVRTFANGKHSSVSQTILNEIAGAKIVLLNPGTKREYDARLKKELAVVVPSTLPARPAPPILRPKPMVVESRPPTLTTQTPSRAGPRVPSTFQRTDARSKRTATLYLVLIGGGAAAVVFVFLGIVALTIVDRGAPDDRLTNVESEQGQETPNEVDTFLNSAGMKLVKLPAGTFQMGCGVSTNEIARRFDRNIDHLNDERPQHNVRLSTSFYLATTEVTQGQWKVVMGTSPWSGQTHVAEGDDYPATYISWDDAVNFCRRLSANENRVYRLPSEAEWEYACRAGTTSIFGFDTDDRLGDHAWFDDLDGNGNAKYEQHVHRVGKKRSNHWGLYDMHGNVFEWCSDWYGKEYYANSPGVDPKGPSSGSLRVIRGGACDTISLNCRAAYRGTGLPLFSNASRGFRVVCELE